MSYILEALRKSERQRREIDEAPLVRLTAAPSPKKSRWRYLALGLSAITNVAVLAYLFGPALFQREHSGEPVAFESRTEGSKDAGNPPAGALPVSGKAAAIDGTLREAKPGNSEKAPLPDVSAQLKPEAVSPDGKAAEVRSSGPAASAPRPVKENARQRASVAQKARPSPDPPESPEELSRPAAHSLPKRLVTDLGRSPPPAELPEPASDNLPRPKINVYAYTPTSDGDRFVIIRNRSYREGDRIEEGAVVRRIEEHAMTLEYAGRTYKVPRP